MYGLLRWTGLLGEWVLLFLFLFGLVMFWFGCCLMFAFWFVCQCFAAVLVGVFIVRLFFSSSQTSLDPRYLPSLR